jgi:hypothetical protein
VLKHVTDKVEDPDAFIERVEYLNSHRDEKSRDELRFKNGKIFDRYSAPLVENLPGVGENLQDHVLVSGVVFKYKGKMPDRPVDSNAVEAEAYLSSSPSGDTDISLVLHQLPVVTPEVASRFGNPPADAFTIAPALVQPTSKGSVRLASDSFQDAAVIDGNYLGTDQDFAAVVRAIEVARELGNQYAFDSLRESELIPGPKASAEEIRELATLASASFGHAVGTCKMGVDKLPPHCAHPSRLAWGLPPRSITVTKNAGPKKIFPIFPHMAAVFAKRSATGATTNLTQNFRTTAAYLMKPRSRAVWNKRSTLWLSPVSGNVASSKGIQCEQGSGWIDNRSMRLRLRLRQQLENDTPLRVQARK